MKYSDAEKILFLLRSQMAGAVLPQIAAIILILFSFIVSAEDQIPVIVPPAAPAPVIAPAAPTPVQPAPAPAAAATPPAPANPEIPAPAAATDPAAIPPDAPKEIPKVEIPKPKGSMPFHSGTVINAELCKYNLTKIIVMNYRKIYEKDSPENLAFAAVTTLLDDGRSIGISDYVLRNAKGEEYPCIAIRSNDGAFDGAAWELKNIQKNEKITMLFLVKMPSENEIPAYSLKFNLYDDKRELKPIEFKYLGDAEFTMPTTVPSDGILLKVK